MSEVPLYVAETLERMERGELKVVNHIKTRLI